ncbi:MAG: helicase C-terminal domain-containing protein [Candidatus Nitrosotenuis sp.]
MQFDAVGRRLRSSYPEIDLKRPREPISLTEALELVGKFAGKEPTPKQYEIIKKIQHAIESGYKKILLSAPTGTGKSWIAIALSLHLRSATVLTSTVLLQDQYRNEFGFFNTVRGKKRFLCEQTNRVFDCTHGYCNDCAFKPKPESYSISKKGTIAEAVLGEDMPRKCPYYDQIEIGKKSSFVAYSYASYLSHLLSGEEMPQRKLLVCDEAHELDEELASQLATNLNGFYGELLGVEMPRFSISSDLGKIKQYVNSFAEAFKKRESVIKECAEHTLYLQSEEHIKKHTHCIRHGIKITEGCTQCGKVREYIRTKEFLRCKDHVECKFDHRYINHFVLNDLKNYTTKMKILQKGLESADQNYIITDIQSKAHDDKNRSRNFDEVTIKPWHIHWFMDELTLGFDLALFMSATINLELFCKETGFRKDEVYFINEDSNIPAQNRKVVFLKTEYVEANAEAVLPDKIISQIEAILKLRSSQRGIILLTSYSQLDYILEKISPELRPRLFALQRGQDKTEAISSHKNIPNSVLISPGLESGVNLPDDDSRFQIIVKAPYYPTVDDLRMKKIYDSEPDHRRYYLKSAFRLLQMAGRSIRHVGDHAMTYVLDSKAERMVYYQRNDLPKWFIEACDGLSA